MGKAFDKLKDNPAADPKVWAEALRICKPGSMLAAFGGDRTHHHLMNALEQAGWEIRTCIYWLFGSGLTKSHNHFGIEGYGTALKPAAEIIVLCMKPLEGTYAQNVAKWGIGGINIESSRISSTLESRKRSPSSEFGQFSGWNAHKNVESFYDASKGRWPASLLLDEQAAEMLDKQSNFSKSTDHRNFQQKQSGDIYQWSGYKAKYTRSGGYKDSGGASRFFYCAKASSSERKAGLDNHNGWHPTVKPLSLMRYLIKLLAPPGSPTLLDPFAGSGSTLIAAKQLGINAVGIELNEEYCEIARKRLEHWKEFDPELPL